MHNVDGNSKMSYNGLIPSNSSANIELVNQQDGVHASHDAIHHGMIDQNEVPILPLLPSYIQNKHTAYISSAISILQ